MKNKGKYKDGDKGKQEKGKTQRQRQRQQQQHEQDSMMRTTSKNETAFLKILQKKMGYREQRAEKPGNAFFSHLNDPMLSSIEFITLKKGTIEIFF